MKYVYAKAPDVAAVAQRIIPLYHARLCDPENPVRIDYLFVDPPPESRGQVKWGKCEVITGLKAYLAAEEDDGTQTPFFVVSIADKVWQVLNDAQREALVDHELCHAGVNVGEHGELKLSIIPHDVEEFAVIVERHGLWESEIKRLVDAALGRETAA